ncbi:hypothetical protein PV797_09640 [Clostridiaceae bacterium M8S5]|nr:hypothetical protein PV797_09640 [Clostridiaceae bacterium M8S5]
MSKGYYLGIDTSAYRTSIALIDDEGSVVCDNRILLDVKKGERGLRQQEAVFKHVNNLPCLFKKISDDIDLTKIRNVVASNSPRKVEGSYMPVFNAGKAQGEIISRTLGIPIYYCSHQEGHIAAALYGCDKLNIRKFLVYHISGGTTELLRVHRTLPYEYSIDIVGGTKDISCGQLVDRTGVKMGLNFPSGIELENLAIKGKLLPRLPVNVSSTWINYSGAETHLTKAIKDGEDYRDVAKSTLYIVASTLSKSVLNYIKNQKMNDIVFAGGVSANAYIRMLLSDNLYNSINIYYPIKSYCSDNAIGNAYIGYMRYNNPESL